MMLAELSAFLRVVTAGLGLSVQTFKGNGGPEDIRYPSGKLSIEGGRLRRVGSIMAIPAAAERLAACLCRLL